MKPPVLAPGQRSFDSRIDAILAARREDRDVDVLEVAGVWVLSPSERNADGLALPPRCCARCRVVRYDTHLGVCRRCRRARKRARARP